MGLKFILTVDTEEDRLGNVDLSSINNITRIIEFQELCNRYSIKPTYLCTYNVAKSDIFRRFTDKNIDKIEVGAHLHPWVTPPFVEIDSYKQKTYPTEYSLEVFRLKMQQLTNTITNYVDKPFSYRAGRFGFNIKEHSKILIELGYKVDSSITPGIDWSHVKGYEIGGPNYSNFTPNYFYILSDGMTSKSKIQNSLLELPITIISYGKKKLWFRIYPQKYKILNYIILSRIKIDNIMKIIEYYKKKDNAILVMFMHSNELHEKYNPYFNKSTLVKKLFKNFEVIFKIINKNDIESITLKEFYYRINKK